MPTSCRDSDTSLNYPLLFTPVYKDYIWGGDRIPKIYGRDLPPGIYAESWEVSDRPEGMSIVSNGELAGRSLHDILASFGIDLVGAVAASSVFPLLIKIIDARQCLSVQVHPDDVHAVAGEGEAKTEMWYVLAAEVGARVYAGFRPDINVGRTQFEKALREERIAELLNPVPVSAGEAVFIPGGRLHAIDAGCLLLEVQQNSNTTYRVYDWGRTGHDGRPRPLHIEQAMRVINWSDTEQAKLELRKSMQTGVNSVWDIIKCAHFQVERLDLWKPLPIARENRSFDVFFTVQGEVSIDASGRAVNVCAGMSVLVPAAVTNYSLMPGSTGAQVLRIRHP